MINCIVTGASSGIGVALAEELVARGCKVLAVARSRDKLLELQERLGSEHLFVCVADLTSETGLQDIKEMVRTNFGTINLLIHNAGTLLNKPFREISGEELHYIYKVNLFAPFKLTQRLQEELLSPEWGHVLAISSIGGNQGSVKFPGLSAYSSSKGALNIWMECMAEEYKETTIRFNTVSMGAVQTGMLEKAFPGYRAPVRPEEVKSFICDIALEGYKVMNGKIISLSLSNP